ncbi:MAG: carboxymethylenebutenolidase [Acidobacteriota bacterium]|jgi:carboxymethylenebutenolidase|nr:carboxymethylenebutenolidase [Acidobacteriota bacterium]
MKRTDKHTESQTEAEVVVSRRKFLEHSATAGGVALVGVAATVGCAAQDGNKAVAGNSASTTTPTPAAQLTGVMTEYPSGTIKIPAYLARPKKKGTVPGAVLVIHEVFGLNDHIKSIADRIANEGYLALAPDFFVRAPDPPPKDAKDMAALRKAASSIPPEAAIKDMQAALDYIKSIDGVRRHFASIGFCMGGGFSYQLATHTKDLKGAVIFYGRTPIELVPQVSCPLLASFGSLDTGIPPEKVKEFEEALKKAGKKADIKVYEGAKHGFFNDTRAEAYNPEAAADAWQRTLKFFRERLGT